MTNKDFARKIDLAVKESMKQAVLSSILVVTEEHASGHLHKHAVVVCSEKVQTWLKLAAELRRNGIYTNVRIASATTRPVERLAAYLLAPTRHKLVVDEQYYSSPDKSALSPKSAPCMS